MRVVGVHRVQSPLIAELTQPMEEGIGAPLWHGWSHPQDLEAGMIYSFSVSISFSYYLVYNVGICVAEEKFLGRSPLLEHLAACT
jgi:hypothetical protein